MSVAEVDTRRRVAHDGLNLIDQGIVLRDPALLDRANASILTMNQTQRDLIENEMVRTGLLPEATIQVLGQERNFRAIDADGNGRLTRQEMDNHLLQQSRTPSTGRNYYNEMVINQVSQRMGDTTLRLSEVNSFAANTISQATNYELALREYNGLASIMRQRYANQFSESGNRFEISAAERALRDDQAGQNRFLSDDQRRALSWMVTNRDDLYSTTLGLGTLFGLATQYFSQAELHRQSSRNGIDPETVRRSARDHSITLEQLSRNTSLIEHQVRPGQTISDIAAASLRDRLGRVPNEQEINTLVTRIELENNLSGRYRLNSGQIIRIPRSVAAPESIPPSPGPAVHRRGGPR